MPGWLGIYVRGIAMGAADIVPGVSGGTVALITGIYDRLLAALASVDVRLLRLVLQRRWHDAWYQVDGAFLVALLAGVLTAIVALANVIAWLLQQYPELLWSFFFGLVAASSVFLAYQELDRPRLVEGLALLLGCIAAVLIALAPAGGFLPGVMGFFLAGAIAICAMILPGISGSFILLLLGMYQPVISALTELRLIELLAFAVGCGLGLLLFSRLLHWLLERYRHSVMSLLTGFLAGSLVALWPWQHTVSTVLDRHGQMRPVQQVPIGPWRYAAEGGDPQILGCLIAAGVGVMIIIATHRWVVAGRD
jgi:putative membrane protein